MRKNAGHKVRISDAVAPTLEGCWVYNASQHEWEYVLWVEYSQFHMMNELGTEFDSSQAIEIEAISPVKVEGTTPANYKLRLEYARAEAGWAF